MSFILAEMRHRRTPTCWIVLPWSVILGLDAGSRVSMIPATLRLRDRLPVTASGQQGARLRVNAVDHAVDLSRFGQSGARRWSGAALENDAVTRSPLGRRGFCRR
jgi:hypothetical protein